MNTTTTTPDALMDSTALTVLQNTRRGEVLNDVGAALREVAGAVMLTGKDGKVTIELAVSKSTIDGALIITDEVKAKVPKSKKPSALFYADDDGNLLREDPKQQTLPLRTVDGGAAAEQPQTLRKVS